MSLLSLWLGEAQDSQTARDLLALARRMCGAKARLVKYEAQAAWVARPLCSIYGRAYFTHLAAECVTMKRRARNL